MSTAPQNVSMMKVAQGWVISWTPPARVPSDPSQLERVEHALSGAHASQQQSLLPALATDSGVSVASMASLTSAAATAATLQNNQPPAAYSVEAREKGTAWQPLATTRERSLLVKDLRPGGEYVFRVYAHSAAGSARGAPSQEYKYVIPDNRRKPGGTQALSAGVVSGILFFIACIVIAVCAVNMCNKRRKKRAEKGELRTRAHLNIAALCARVCVLTSKLTFYMSLAHTHNSCLCHDGLSSARKPPGHSGAEHKLLAQKVSYSRLLGRCCCGRRERARATIAKLLERNERRAARNFDNDANLVNQCKRALVIVVVVVVLMLLCAPPLMCNRAACRTNLTHARAHARTQRQESDHRCDRNVRAAAALDPKLDWPHEACA